MSHFSGQVVWITGGGSGIGRALAVELASQGAAVAVTGRREHKLAETVAAVKGGGGQALAVPGDVTDEAGMADVVAKVVAEMGRLDVAVANAGYVVEAPFAEITSDQWRQQIAVNVLGCITTGRAALPELQKNRGRLVLVSSVAGFFCSPHLASYNATKFAVRALGLTLSQEFHGSGVSCTTIYPGMVESEIIQTDNEGQYKSEVVSDERQAKLVWPAGKAARVMAKAIRKRKREFVFTGHGRFAAFIGKHFPGLAHFIMVRQLKS